MRWRSTRSMRPARAGLLQRGDVAELHEPRRAGPAGRDGAVRDRPARAPRAGRPAGPGAAATGEVELVDEPGVVAVGLGEAELDVVVLAGDGVAEAGDLFIAADHQAQGRADVLGVDAEVRRPGAVDADAKLRLAELEGGVGVGDAELLGPAPERLGVLRRFGSPARGW